MSGGDDPILEIEAALDRAGRMCRNLLISEPRLTHQHFKKLTQWLYGCMNQRYTIRRRITDRGIGEYDKALKFMAGALTAVSEIEEQFERR
jgi:hypothetical protein